MSRFLHGVPVPPDRFIGRRREIDDLIGRIFDHGQSAAVIGEPRIGKTSLLEYLASPNVLAGGAQAGSKRLLISKLNAHSLVTDFNQARFWGDAFDAVEPQGALDATDANFTAAIRACRRKNFETRAMERLLRSFATAGVRLVLLVDEFDYLVDRCVAQHSEFFAGLRALAIGGHRAMAIVVASRRSLSQLNDLARRHGYGGSPYFNAFAEILLGPLSPAEIDELLLPAQDRFSPEDRRFIHDLSGGYPYLVQAAADALWRAYDNGDPDAVTRRRTAGSALLRAASQTLDDIWRHWPPRTRYAFAAVAVEHLAAMGPRIAWGSAGAPGGPGGPSAARPVDQGSFPEELHTLEQHGMIGRNPSTPSGFGVQPIIFLRWVAVQLRSKSQSARLWAEWIREEGWDAILSARRKQLWEGVIREQAVGVRTDVELLLAANDALAGRGPVPPLPLASEPPPEGDDLPSSRPLFLVCLHAEIDEPHRSRLDNHLAPLKREGQIEIWCPRDVAPGADFQAAIDENLARAHIVLLLLSADLLGAGDFVGEQLERAIELHERKKAHVIPIRLRPLDWSNLPLASLAPLPNDGRAVTQWSNQDEAWADVAAGIRRVVEELSPRRTE